MKARITRRFVDEFSWQETASIEFISPRGLEDSILDDQLSMGCAYRLPRDLPEIPIPSPSAQQRPSSAPQKKDEYRPPTPPKARDKFANSPRKSPRRLSGNSPIGTNTIKAVRLSPVVRSPDHGLKANLSRIDEDGLVKRVVAGDGDEGGSSNHDSVSTVSEKSNVLSTLVQSPVVKALVEAAVKGKKSVRFSDENELNEISKLQASAVMELFYGSEELAEFRYEAFMEEAGLDIADFD